MNDSRRNTSDVAVKVILLLVLLNSADTFYTALALKLGVLEGNPIVASVLDYGMTWFLFYKLILVNSMIVFAGFFGWNYSVGRVGLKVTSWVYSLLLFWHMANLSFLYITGSLH